jgi:glycosyltransferase involved in cell wall biosynthesis
MSQLVDLSIIVPVFNRKNDLLKTLNAIVGFENITYEVIVVDDGSHDPRDCDVVDGFDWCVKLRKSNGGLASARNFGMTVARGRYLYFLDAGDEPIRNLCEYLKSVIISGADIGVCSWTHSSGRGTSSIINIAEHAASTESSICSMNIAPVHSYLVNRKSVGPLRFNETYRFAEDWNFWLQCLYAGKTFVVFPDYWSHYEVTSESMSQNTIGMLVSFCRNTWEFRSMHKTLPGTLPYLIQSYSNACHAIICLLRKDFRFNFLKWVRECYRCQHLRLLWVLPYIVIKYRLLRPRVT